MKNFPKAGLLIVTLVIPALIFVFLQFFGTNHYNLPYYNPATDENGKVLLHGKDTVFNKITETCVIGGSADFKGRVTVINSLPAECDEKCEIMFAQLQRVFELTNEISDLNLLTLSLTGTTKPENLPDKLHSRKWQLVGTLSKHIDNCFYTSALPATSDFSTDEQVMLVDREGYIRGYYNGSDEKEIDRLMAEIKILDYENKASRL